jgi:hypothetical protein
MKESRTRAALAALTLMAIVGPAVRAPSFTPRSAPPRPQRAVVALTSIAQRSISIYCSRLRLSGFSMSSNAPVRATPLARDPCSYDRCHQRLSSMAGLLPPL